jgi:peptidoglycan/xylan/chitin deacetylase (PgdA/CDA1 family)
MSHKAYLTIDDSPSAITNDLIDFLEAEDIQSLIFVRGDYLAQNPAPIIRAIEKGHVIGNHLYSHQRASKLSIAQIKEEITKTEALIEQAYMSAGKARTVKSVRFPYLDRAMGAWFVEPDHITAEHTRGIFEDLIEIGLGNDKNKMPTPQQINAKNEIQNFLKEKGFKQPLFPECTAGWYNNNSCIKMAADTAITCSSSDWMLTQRHMGNWPFENVEALTDKMMKSFTRDTGAQIILLHDQSELEATFKAFIKNLQDRDVEFLPIH